MLDGLSESIEDVHNLVALVVVKGRTDRDPEKVHELLEESKVMMPPIIVSHGPAWVMMKAGQQHLRLSLLFYASK